MKTKSCCMPASEGGLGNSQMEQKVTPDKSGAIDIPVLAIPGQRGLIGTDRPILKEDAESPCRPTRFKRFAMMQTTVTNEMFARFVDSSGYVSEAEEIGWSFVFHDNLPEEMETERGSSEAQWWRCVDGASWKALSGPGSEQELQPGHPVVHVSWRDARAFATWAGGRLPTEAEWEHAARGGLGDVRFPWGDREPNDTDFQPCNIWQGRFPEQNTVKDGYKTTAPAKSFEPNGYGLYNMCGNVWEWTSEPYKLRSMAKSARKREAEMRGRKLLKGGSFLCHSSYCYRYRIAARSSTTPDTSTSHQGFRLVFDLP